MLQRLTGIHLFVVFTHLSVCFSNEECYFKFTNEWKNKCELSKWIEWNCTCCGTNVMDLALAKRAKGICCPKYMNTAEDLETCTRYCNVSTASLFDQGLCGTYCTHVTHPSPCHVPATTNATQDARTITASSTPTIPTLITTSSSTTGQSPARTTVTTLTSKGNSPATSTATNQTPSRKSKQISQPNHTTSRLASRTTVSKTSGLLSSKT